MGVGKYKELLKSGGFRSFLWAQFLGALNDNLYKMIVSLFALSVALSAAGASKYLSLGQAVFILPFFLFSGYAGHMADVFSKREGPNLHSSFRDCGDELGLACLLFTTS